MTEACEGCRYWNDEGPKGSPRLRFNDTNQIFARYCQRFPDFVWRYPDEWCGEFVAGSFKDDTLILTSPLAD